jgi:hypothetical protein
MSININMKTWINYDTKPKFLISAGITLFVFSFVLLIGCGWIYDQQTDKSIAITTKFVELGYISNSTFLSIANTMLERNSLVQNFIICLGIISIVSTIVGTFFIIVGYLWWYKEK